METHSTIIEYYNKWRNELEKTKDERDPEINIYSYRSSKADIDLPKFVRFVL